MKERNNNKIAIRGGSKTTDEEWLTIKEMIGLPGMPGTPQGCNQKMAESEFLLENQALKKKVPGTKAYSYHWSLLPLETREYWATLHGLELNLTSQEMESGQGKRHLEHGKRRTPHTHGYYAEIEANTRNVDDKTTDRAAQLIIDVFSTLPNESYRQRLLGVMLECAGELLKTASNEKSASLSDTQEREILPERDPHENTAPAPTLSTQDKKAG